MTLAKPARAPYYGGVAGAVPVDLPPTEIPAMFPTPADALAVLNQNVAAWYADAITFEEFGRRNRRAWDAIGAEGRAFSDAVLSLWRDAHRAA